MLTESERAAIYRRGYQDPVWWCSFFLEEWFSTPMPWFHRGVLAIMLERPQMLLDFRKERWGEEEFEWTKEGLDKILRHFVWRERPDDPTSEERPVFRLVGDKLLLHTTDLSLILMPRGFSKTTLMNAANLWSAVYATEPFMLYISESGQHAEGQLQNVKDQLENNERLILFYGSIVPDRNDARKWRGDYIETTNNVRVAARGRGGQIRGLLRRGQRPSRITVDDVEDEESVATDDMRKKTRSWFWRAVVPALPKLRRGRIFVLGNMLHVDALLPNLARDPSFLTIVFGAIDRDGAALWERNMSLDKLERTKRSYLIAGELPGYYLEYFNLIRSDDTSIFSARMIRYQVMQRTEFVGIAECIDPAISDKKEGDPDFCTVGTVGITDKGMIHVLEVEGRKGWNPREQVEEYFRQHFRWLPHYHGVEAIAYQAALIHLLQEEMFRKSKEYGVRAYFEITPITHSKQKVARIKGILAPRYRSGYVSHQMRFPELETQLFDFPNGKKDYPDVIAMAISLLDPYAGTAADPEQAFGDSMKPLEEELGEWRSAP